MFIRLGTSIDFESHAAVKSQCCRILLVDVDTPSPESFDGKGHQHPPNSLTKTTRSNKKHLYFIVIKPHKGNRMLFIPGNNNGFYLCDSHCDCRNEFFDIGRSQKMMTGHHRLPPQSHKLGDQGLCPNGVHCIWKIDLRGMLLRVGNGSGSETQRMAQEVFGLGKLTAFKQPPNGRGADMRIADMAFIDTDNPQVRNRHQLVVTNMVMAKAVVVAHNKRLSAHSTSNIALDELRTRQCTECLIEGDNDDMIDAQPLKDRDFFVEGRQQMQPFHTTQCDAWMGVERQQDALALLCPGFGDKLRNQSLMTAVHTIVDTNRNNGARETWKRG